MKSVNELDLSGLHVLDGGMATELERKGFDLSGPLWSAHVLESSPEAIASVHRDYLEAGADRLLTASYQVSAEGFQQIGLGPQDAGRALRASVAIAEKVRGASTRPRHRAGSGLRLRSDPTARCCTTERSITVTTAAPSLSWWGSTAGASRCWPRPMPTFWLSRAFPHSRKPRPSWLLFSRIRICRYTLVSLAAMGRMCRTGETLATCGELLDKQPEVIAIGVNCTRPELIGSLIHESGNRPASPSSSIQTPESSGMRCIAAGRGMERYRNLASWRGSGEPRVPFGLAVVAVPAREHVRAVADVWRG